MNLIKQPNCWSCLPTSFAMAMDFSIELVIHNLGHDGSEIIWPSYPEPIRRKSFHIQELIRLAYNLRYAVIPFDSIPVMAPEEDGPEHVVELDFETILYNCLRGVITGISPSGSRHAVAWNGSKVYDPNGTKYDIEEFTIETLWVVERLK